MQRIFNFLAGGSTTLGLIETSNFLPGNNPALDNVNNWHDLLKALISILGGILSTVVFNILKAKFPDLFTRRNKRRGKLEN